MNESELSHVLAMHRLLKASYLVAQPFFANFADRYALSMNELRILMTLAAIPDAASYELSRATGMHPMNVSRAIAALSATGRVVQRRDSAVDRRRKIVSLTPEGLYLHSKLLPHVKKMAEFMFEGMTELEVEFLSKLLRRLNGRLQNIDPTSPLLIDTAAISGEPGFAPDQEKQTAVGARRRSKAEEG